MKGVEHGNFTMNLWNKLFGSKETLQAGGVKSRSTPSPPGSNPHPHSIHQASQAGDIETVKAFITNGVDVNSKNETGKTPLHLAAECGNEAIAELLLTVGAEVNAKDNSQGPGYLAGSTALHRATSRGSEEVVRLLLVNKADVNARDNNGAVPLHYAAFEVHESVARLLLASGADVNARANNGDTPLAAAARVHQEAVEEAISVSRGLGGSVPIRNASGHTALMQVLRQHGGHE